MRKLAAAVLMMCFLAACEKSATTGTADPSLKGTDTAAKKSAADDSEARTKKLAMADANASSIAGAQSSAEEKGVLAKMIHFDFDKYELRADAKATLKDVADYLKANKDLNIVVEGHCDERGTREYNLALGNKRSEAAKKYLSDLGIEDKRLKIVSFGKDKPLVNESNEEAWAKNRRCQFRRS